MHWRFEIFKMCMYVSFPVGIFHYFNQPANFEEWVINMKKEYFPKESKKVQQEVEDFIQDFNAKAEKYRLEEMERLYKNKQ